MHVSAVYCHTSLFVSFNSAGIVGELPKHRMLETRPCKMGGDSELISERDLLELAPFNVSIVRGV